MKFKFDIDKRISENFYSADYFIKTQTILEKHKKNQKVTMQWFQRKDDVIFCGISYILQMLKKVVKNYNDLEILSLDDGEIINSLEPVLKITGDYFDFGKYEGLIDGILSRATSVATNAYNLKKVANGKKIINMNDRADFYMNQQLDGYASFIGGIKNLVTPASCEYIGGDLKNIQGTMPHALIESFDGDLLKASRAFVDTFPNNDLVILVDYNNDCVNDALMVAKEFNKKLKAIRIDTSKALIDKSLKHLGDKIENYGVNPTLVKMVREKLDINGFNHIKIIVSSGFDVDKIKFFEENNTPVDVYGVGEAMIKKRIHFTGDAVKINGVNQAKVGRQNIESNRLKRVK